ncbi:MAG: hypothetical protein ACYDBZ_16485 [Steroidobacteraceae bacterium]
MTLLSYRYFVCKKGHRGIETKSENDQSYSKGWESTDADGMRESGTDKTGAAVYVCASGGSPMTLVRKERREIEK